MTTLEDLYYGNIEPCDTDTLKMNPRYIESLELVGRLQQEITSSMKEEQKKRFGEYLDKSNELASVIAEDAFKTGFSLAMKIMIEIK